MRREDALVATILFSSLNEAHSHAAVGPHHRCVWRVSPVFANGELAMTLSMQKCKLDLLERNASLL